MSVATTYSKVVAGLRTAVSLLQRDLNCELHQLEPDYSSAAQRAETLARVCRRVIEARAVELQEQRTQKGAR